MLYAAHVAELNAPTEDGSTLRAYLEEKARRGDGRAATQLEDPERPVALEYLWSRFQTLDAMRPEGVNGRAPLTPAGILAANRLFRWRLTPLEVDGLHALDVATRHPQSMREPAEDRPVRRQAWPASKGTPV